jgi:hypothetical protein
MDRALRPEAEVEGRPTLALRDQDREALADSIAELLINAIDHGQPPESEST